MWWNKKKVINVKTKEQIKTEKILRDAQNKVYKEIITAINNEDEELAKKWLDLFERINRYSYEWWDNYGEERFRHLLFIKWVDSTSMSTSPLTVAVAYR